MNRKLHQRTLRRIGIVLSIVLTPIILLTAILIGFQSKAMASSHREAPLISKDPSADNTDTYVFISPENKDNIVFIASWIPLEAPEGGPNYYEWDDSALYDIYVDNDGDAKADITYTLSSRVKVENPATFLYNTGPITTLTTSKWNRKQYITVTETTKDSVVNLVTNQLAPPVNIGSKSTPNYQTLADAARYTKDGVRVFAGQTDDPFWVDLQIFDLLTLRGQQPPIGYTDGTNIPVDSLSGFNVHSLVIEAPIARVTNGTDPVIGMWSGTRRPTLTVLASNSQASAATAYKQVSRLGMPLVNEVVIPMGLKDLFNSIRPEQDLGAYGALQKLVEDPEIGNLLCTLYKPNIPLPADANKDCQTEFTAGTPRSGRGDIFDIFLTGMRLHSDFTIHTKNGDVTLHANNPAEANINQPSNPNITTPVPGVIPAEMLRINTNIKDTLCAPTPSRLGILGGDACGFPNGRRLTDDVVEIELLAVAGAAYPVLDGRDATFTPNTKALLGVLTDGVDYNDIPFRGATKPGDAPTTFPYLGTAQSGQSHWHTNPFYNILLPWINKN